MFSQDSVDRLLNDNKLTKEIGEKLLTIYLGEDENWWECVNRLHKQLLKKKGEKDTANDVADRLKNVVSFAILMQSHDRSIRIDREHPQNNLFWAVGYHQLEQKDWLEELKRVVKKDVEIANSRKQILQLGVIDPIEYHPYSRQAYKWICEAAEATNIDLNPTRKSKYRKFVMTYGGAVVSHVLYKNRPLVDRRVVNWRTTYFLERAIHEVYQLDQILKIKENDLKSTNPDWVKQVRG